MATLQSALPGKNKKKYFYHNEKNIIQARIMVTTAPLKPIRIHHIAKLEHIEIIWSIDHWSDDEKNSLLFYQASLTIESLSNQGRKRRNVETSCSEGDFFFSKIQNFWLLRRRAN